MSEIDEHWKISAIALSIILVLGVLPSYVLHDWTWFSRSGSLLVVYGLYVVWIDIRGDVHGALEQVKEAAIKKYGEGAQEVVGLTAEIQTQNRNLYRTLEFIVIGVGTLIWGFGDLPNVLYSH